MTQYDIIKDAIANKRQITATYQNHVRIMCPHVIGTKNGREQALFFQFGGTSASEGTITPENGRWRCLAIEQLDDVSAQNGDWHTRDDHSQDQTCVDDVDLEVEY